MRERQCRDLVEVALLIRIDKSVVVSQTQRPPEHAAAAGGAAVEDPGAAGVERATVEDEAVDCCLLDERAAGREARAARDVQPCQADIAQLLQRRGAAAERDG